MLVHFRKTGARRYAVLVERDHAPTLVAQAPGYDDYLPHDLLHFVAEAEWGLDGGVFGQLAAGRRSGHLPAGRARAGVEVDPAPEAASDGAPQRPSL